MGCQFYGFHKNGRGVSNINCQKVQTIWLEILITYFIDILIYFSNKPMSNNIFICDF